MRESSLDPTRLELIPIEAKRAFNDQDEITNERIVQFVLESRGNVNVPDDDEDGTTETICPDKLIFYVNPVRKIAFLNAFHVALSNLQSRNFQF